MNVDDEKGLLWCESMTRRVIGDVCRGGDGQGVTQRFANDGHHVGMIWL